MAEIIREFTVNGKKAVEYRDGDAVVQELVDGLTREQILERIEASIATDHAEDEERARILAKYGGDPDKANHALGMANFQKKVDSQTMSEEDFHKKYGDDEDNNTPLHDAWLTDPYAIADIVELGADPNARNNAGNTPLHLVALYNSNPKVIDALLEAQADPNVRNNAGDAALHLAAWNNPEESVIAALLRGGAKLEARDVHDRTPLHVAASLNQNPAVITVLLGAGASLEARDNTGDTPLHLAAWFNHHPPVIATLLEAGADRHARDKFGRVPWDYAKGRDVLTGSDVYRRLSERPSAKADAARPNLRQPSVSTGPVQA